MKLVTFSSPHGPERVGLLRNDRVLDLGETQRGLGQPRRPYFGSMSRLIEAGPEALAEIRSLEKQAPSGWGYSLGGVALRAPLLNPPRIRQTCLYLSSLDEIAGRFAKLDASKASDPEKARQSRLDEISSGFRLIHGMKSANPDQAFEDAGVYFRLNKVGPPDLRDEMPLYWPLDPLCISSPGAKVEVPALAEQPDLALQIAAVIGRQGRDVGVDQASGYIFGYTLINDLTIRNRAAWSRNLGKPRFLPLRPGVDFPGSVAIGPCIVTADEFSLHTQSCSVHVNSELVAQRTLGAPTYTFEEAIKYMSRSMDVYPGDMIASGPLPGLSTLMFERNVGRGDTVEVRASQMGGLRTTLA